MAVFVELAFLTAGDSIERVSAFLSSVYFLQFSFSFFFLYFLPLCLFLTTPDSSFSLPFKVCYHLYMPY